MVFFQSLYTLTLPKDQNHWPRGQTFHNISRRPQGHQSISYSLYSLAVEIFADQFFSICSHVAASKKPEAVTQGSKFHNIRERFIKETINLNEFIS